MNVLNQVLLVDESKEAIYKVDSHADYEGDDIQVDLEGEFILDSFRYNHCGCRVHQEDH